MYRNSTKSSTPPQVIYKEEEFAEMCRLISELYIYSDTNLATALHVDRGTIAGWKKRPEAIEAHKKAVQSVLSLRKKKQLDTNKSLKELGIETEADEQKFALKIVVEGLEQI